MIITKSLYAETEELKAKISIIEQEKKQTLKVLTQTTKDLEKCQSERKIWLDTAMTSINLLKNTGKEPNEKTTTRKNTCDSPHKP